MSKFATLLGLAATSGLMGTVAVARTAPRVPSVEVAPLVTLDDPKDEKDEKKDAGKTEEKVAIDQLPAAVVATVMKECPGGKITEAEKVTKKGKTYYSLDVKVGDAAYDVKTTLDGKFQSKKVDEDEKDEHDEKK